jgi:hypothetical protein
MVDQALLIFIHKSTKCGKFYAWLAGATGAAVTVTVGVCTVVLTAEGVAAVVELSSTLGVNVLPWLIPNTVKAYPAPIESNERMKLFIGIPFNISNVAIANAQHTSKKRKMFASNLVSVL